MTVMKEEPVIAPRLDKIDIATPEMPIVIAGDQNDFAMISQPFGQRNELSDRCLIMDQIAKQDQSRGLIIA